MTRIAFILLLLYSSLVWGVRGTSSIELEASSVTFQDSLQWADYYYNIHRYKKAIPLYKKNLDESEEEKSRILKKLALSEAALEHPSASVAYLHDYLRLDFEPSFLLHEGFDKIREYEEFSKVSNRVLPKLTAWSIFYFLIGLVGFYIIATLLFNKKIELPSKILVSSFVFIHSIFLLNISTNMSNYVFVYPHTYLMTSWSSLLYGPLLFLYFKKTSQKNILTKYDLLHIIPTVLLLLYFLSSTYLLSGNEKIELMLERLKNGMSSSDFNRLVLIVGLKALSLIIYAYFLHRALKKIVDSKMKLWHRNIYTIHVTYVITYIIYGVSIILRINSGIYYHVPLIAMGIMVLYLGYTANVQPNVFSGLYSYTNQLFPKYVKSGLTDSLSTELKEELLELLVNQKLYRRNDISLGLIAEKLNTTRHNASQIINEQFKMNFHELINKYRIEEAKELLRSNSKSTIIDIAYEVGYNNKVSFNKAFKKDTELTPSQYLQYIKEET